MSDNPYEHVVYPPEIPEAVMDDIIARRIAAGWPFREFSAEKQAHLRLQLSIRLRLHAWLTAGLRLTRSDQPTA